ncbi:MAG TPA: DNA-binding response regulator [Gammaproteobacteria bacterium]|nr:DNA-binding response regulator [Gammaproteobacteria bacterium]HAU06358.1 DNA-binding response regulator [Gammaproteobacteria bacterium]
MDTIYIVDDEAALRDSLSMLLEAEDFITQQFADPKLFLSQIDSEQQGLVILDLWMPGMSGIDVIKALNTKGISLPIICITGHGDINTAVEAIKLGAADFFEKPFDSNRLLDQIKHCLKAQQNQRQLDVFSTQAKEKLSKLTPREYEVLQGLVEGLRNKQLAYNMGISIRTVELHRVHVMDKLEAKSLSDVIKIAIAADYENMTL